MPVFHTFLSIQHWHQHCEGVGLIPAEGPIVNDEFLSTVHLNLNMCMISTQTKTHYFSEISINYLFSSTKSSIGPIKIACK